jgi:hypothetical protein
MNEIKLTEASKALFLALWNDRGNWGDTPLWGGNVGGSAADRGNLTDLKSKGLVTTFKSDRLDWVAFTDAGKAFAAHLTA